MNVEAGKTLPKEGQKKEKQAFDYVIKEVLGISEDKPLFCSLKNAEYDSIDDICLMSDNEVLAMKFGQNPEALVPMKQRKLLLHLLKWRDWMSQKELVTSDTWLKLTKDAFIAFKQDYVVHMVRKGGLEATVTASGGSDVTASKTIPVLSRPDVEDLIKETDTMLTSWPQQTTEYKKHFKKLWRLDVELINWLTALAARELSDSYHPTTGDEDGKSLICRFYHYYVKFLQQYFKRHSEGLQDTRIFISFSGSERCSYAKPLFGFLARHINEDRIFFDEKDITASNNPDNRILEAAVCCQKYWGVVSKSFIRSRWPMREFLLASTRWVQEQEGKGRESADTEEFHLIVDCLDFSEAEGSWFDKLRKMAALQIYDKDGQTHPFPFAKKFKGENPEVRREDIAAEVGLIPKRVTYHVLAAGTLSQVLIGRFKSAKTIHILDTWTPNLEVYANSIIEAVNNGAVVRFLLLDFRSTLTKHRSRAIAISSRAISSAATTGSEDIPNASDSDRLRESASDAKLGVQLNLVHIQDMKREVTEDRRGAIKVRLYDSLPSLALYRTDNKYVSGTFFHGRLAFRCPHLDVHQSSEMGHAYDREFEKVWDIAKRFDPNDVRLGGAWSTCCP